MHIGILGTGFGKYHGSLYQKIDPSIQLTYWGRNSETLMQIGSELHCDYTTDISALLDNQDLDFIDICLPSQLHAEYALLALRKNHAVFLETPAVTTIEDGLAIMEAAKKADKKVLVNMFLLYDPYYRMIHDLCQSKKYGELKHITLYRRTPPIWGALGSDKIAMSLMIHDLDFAAWLGKDLKLISCSVTDNPDHTGAVIDCLLSNETLQIHVEGNSMRSPGTPFSVGYEATFEHATICYQENDSEAGELAECTVYTKEQETKISFPPEAHCRRLLEDVLHDFRNKEASALSIENALPALKTAFALGKSVQL